MDPANFLSAPGLEWQVPFKKTKAQLELLTYIDMLLMVEKGVRGGICHAVHRYVQADNKLRWSRAEDLVGSEALATTRGFKLPK